MVISKDLCGELDLFPDINFKYVKHFHSSTRHRACSEDASLPAREKENVYEGEMKHLFMVKDASEFNKRIISPGEKIIIECFK